MAGDYGDICVCGGQGNRLGIEEWVWRVEEFGGDGLACVAFVGTGGIVALDLRN